MVHYKLLTPGPLTTSDRVKEEMLFDRCTWDHDYKEITQKIRKKLLKIAGAAEKEHTAVLMQGSGTFAVESVLTTAVSKRDKLLIISNGAYGERIVQTARYIGLNYTVYETAYDEQPETAVIKKILSLDKDITHLVMVHCETTTGILNPLEEVAGAAQEFGKTFIVDAMSSFGGIEIDVPGLDIDYLVSSANKCIQGVPGFAFVIAKKEKLAACEGNARSLSLDLYDQWKVMEPDGKWRFTSPTHAVAAFARALEELEEEGGVPARAIRYQGNNRLLREKMEKLGFQAYIAKEKQSPIITAFLFPDEDFDFDAFYTYVKERGYVLYPGKLTEENTFRIGNIGEIYREDIEDLCRIIEEYIEDTRTEITKGAVTR